MSEEFEIKPLEGFGPLVFGMTSSEVRAILGEEQVHEEWMDDYIADALYYAGIFLNFNIWTCRKPLNDAPLIEIALNVDTFPHTALLLGKPVSDWSWQNVAVQLDAQFGQHEELFGLKGELGGLRWEQVGFEIDFNENDYVNFIHFWKPLNQSTGEVLT